MTSIDHGAHGEAAAFIDTWHAREPEMAIAQVFCPRPLRLRFALWGALLMQWREAALELSDPRPTHVKCMWWAEEAAACAQATMRHPLTIALAKPDLPWPILAHAMASMADADTSRPPDRMAAMERVAPLADAIATLESALFDIQVNDSMRRAVAVHLLGERLRIGRENAEGGLLPLSLLARHGLLAAELSTAKGVPAHRDWAAELARALPEHLAQGCLYRRMRGDFDAWRLQEMAAGKTRPLPPFRALFRAWRCARRIPAAC
ncbi:MAG: hypothetical protein JSR26_13105 [Proteobacteria bacterium]|nr:hypothetical protein [Pseudomonadota bacterium]